ncbi:MAG TPA: asparaginase [Patescibacteria group bacterium]
MKPKILLLSMGGTIFSIVENNVVRTAHYIQELMNQVPRLHDIAELDFEVVVNLDSTNVGIDEWMLLHQRITEKYDQYDGFVVAHGTNTMAYTASALAFSLGSTLNKPVVLTGSQLPLSVYGDDAHFNLEHSVRACCLAIDQHICEVMVSFHDVVLRGCRTVKVSESNFAAFSSPAFPPLAQVTANGISFSGLVRKRQGGIFERRSPQFSSSIICIDIVPGLDPMLLTSLVERGEIKGIVLKSHGAGSVPDQGRGSFLPFIESMVKQDIVVIITTKFLGGNSSKMTNDEPAVRALEAGAISSRDMTDVAAQIKLMYLLGNGNNASQVRDRFTESFVGEVS